MGRSRAASLWVLLTVTSTVAAGPSAPAAEVDPPRNHPPIVIRGDADFLLPTSGVAGGRGTAHDPYVIEAWEIVPLRLHGVFDPAQQQVRPGANCLPTWDASTQGALLLAAYPSFHGIQITDTRAHVLIRNNWIHAWPPTGVEDPTGRISSQYLIGILLVNASNVRVEHNTIEELYRGVCARQLDDLSIFANTVRRVVLDSVKLDKVRGAHIEANRILGDGVGQDSARGVRAEESPGVVIRKNLIVREGHSGVFLDGSPGGVVDGNEISGPLNVAGSTSEGVTVWDSSRTIVERNVVRRQDFAAVRVQSSAGVVVRDNDLEANQFYGLYQNTRFFTFEEPIDARFNWWGCAEGPVPSDDSFTPTTGACQEVTGLARFDPWRTEPVVDAGPGAAASP